MILAAKHNALLRPMFERLGEDSPADLSLVELKSGERLTPNDPTRRHIYFPISTLLSLEWTSAAEDRIQIDLVGPQGVTGLMDLEGVDARRQVTVVVTGHAVRLPLTAWPVLLERYPDAQRWPFGEWRAMARSASNVAVCVATHGIAQRLARWILHASRLARRETLPISQQDLARFLAVRRESVSHGLRRFAHQGLVTLARQSIVVEQPEALAKEACPCLAERPGSTSIDSRLQSAHTPGAGPGLAPQPFRGRRP